MSAQTIATWLGIAVILSGVIAQFVSLNEAKDTTRSQITDHERRLGVIERDTSQLERYQAVQLSLQKLQYEMTQLRSEVQDLQPERRHGR